MGDLIVEEEMNCGKEMDLNQCNGSVGLQCVLMHRDASGGSW